MQGHIEEGEEKYKAHNDFSLTPFVTIFLLPLRKNGGKSKKESNF